MPATFLAMVAALRAAIGAMETWSSCPAEVGTLSTLAGKARLRFSATSAACVTCGIISPELTPPSSVRKAGRPLILGSISTAVRRSEMRADLAHRHGDGVGGEGDRLGMEIAAADRDILILEHDRIVGHGAGLDGQGAGGVGQQVERRAHHLRLAAEAVGVLHPAAAEMAVDDFAAVEKTADFGGDADLAGLAADRADARIERLDRALERIDRQRAGGERRAEYPLGHEQVRRAR